MKIYITTNTKLNLTELAEFHIEPVVMDVMVNLRPKWNNLHAEMWGDFNQVRELSPKTGFDARCFLTTIDKLKEIGIKGHWGMYDLMDSDGILDFYAGIPKTLDTRARKNGFKTNETWLVIHELCHGLLQKQGRSDYATYPHEMEDISQLKELYFELYNELLKEKISLLEKLIILWKRYIKS